MARIPDAARPGAWPPGTVNAARERMTMPQFGNQEAFL